MADNGTSDDEQLERWLRTEVVTALAEHDADPSQAIPADQVMQRLRARLIVGEESGISSRQVPEIMAAVRSNTVEES